MQVAYHYTVGQHIRNILADKLIKREGCNSHCNRRHVPLSENPVVWFTTNAVWEPTATKSVLTNCGWLELNKKQLSDILGIYRIAVPELVAPIRWDEYRQTISAPKARQLLNKAYKIGSKPSEWRISLDPVPSDKWLAVQRLFGEEWRTLSSAEQDELRTSPFLAENGLPSSMPAEYMELFAS